MTSLDNSSGMDGMDGMTGAIKMIQGLGFPSREAMVADAARNRDISVLEVLLQAGVFETESTSGHKSLKPLKPLKALGGRP